MFAELTRSQLRVPLQVEMDLTNECNLRCPHCNRTGLRLDDEFSSTEFKRLIDELVHLGVFLSAVSGAEPLLRKDAIEILEYASKKGLAVMVGTNLTYDIPPETMKRLASITLKVATSLDGPTSEIHDSIRGKGTFEKTIEGIQKLLENNCRVMIESTILKPNINVYESIIELAAKLGVQEFTVFIAAPVGRAAKNPNILPTVDEIKQTLLRIRRRTEKYKNLQLHVPSDDSADPLTKKCDCGITRCSVRADGKVFPCSNFHSYSEVAAGDLKKDSFERIWSASKLFEQLRNRSERGCPAVLYASQGKT